MAQEETTDFASILRSTRRDAGLSQEQLAERAGLSARAISDLERGVNRAPRRDTLEMLADALALSPDERRRWERLRLKLAAQAEQHRARSRAARWDAPEALRASYHQRTNLLSPPTPSIGREREIVVITEWLRDDPRRIVTLIGPGGSGKTRLAIEAGMRLLDTFSEGVYFADLAPITDPGLVMTTIAEAIGIRQLGDQPIALTLRETLRDRSILLIVDNLEQVLDAAIVLSELFAHCSRLRVLATSRAPLRVRGEREFPVLPLQLPDLAESADSLVVSRNDAVRLFVERARDVLPDFTLTTENAAAVAAICVRLDGLPLAIEMAAARAKLLTPQAMLARLEHRLAVLADGARDLPPRQQTLRNTIDWSYDLLEPAEQRLFRQLATFAGGWTLEAADATCDPASSTDSDMSTPRTAQAHSGAEESARVPDVTDALSVLIDQSLVRRVEQPDGSMRFMMLETLREYGRDRLVEHHEVDDLRERHAAYFLAMAESVAPHLEGSEPVPFLKQLATEHDNLRATLDWFYLSGDAQHGLCMVGHLREFWNKRGLITEGRSQAARFLGLPGAERPSLCRAMALTSAAWLALRQNDPSAIEHATEALAIWTALGTETHVSFLLLIQGVAADNFHGDIAQAVRFHEQGLAVARKLGDTKNIARMLGVLGAVERRLGNQDQAQSFLAESMTLARQVDDTQSLAFALGVVAGLALDADNPDRAAELFQERLRLYQRLDDMWGILRTLHNLALVAVAQAQPEPATRLLAAVASLRERTGLAASPWDQPILETTRFDLITMLGAVAFEDAWAAGAALATDEAIAEALALQPNH